jgi:hypothetical protein
VGRLELMLLNAAQQRRTAIVLLGALACLIGTAWYVYGQLFPAYVPVPPFTQHRVVSAFTQNGVHVDIALEQDADGTLMLAGTYTPIDAHVHLYSTDLPRAGLNGAGRPTLLELPMQPGVHPIGPPTTDQPVILDQFTTLNIAFPVYPDGAVTIRLPIAVASHAAQTPMTVNVTYMACSSTGFCLPPVEDKSIALVIAATP